MSLANMTNLAKLIRYYKPQLGGTETVPPGTFNQRIFDVPEPPGQWYTPRPGEIPWGDAPPVQQQAPNVGRQGGAAIPQQQPARPVMDGMTPQPMSRQLNTNDIDFSRETPWSRQPVSANDNIRTLIGQVTRPGISPPARETPWSGQPVGGGLAGFRPDQPVNASSKNANILRKLFSFPPQIRQQILDLAKRKRMARMNQSPIGG